MEDKQRRTFSGREGVKARGTPEHKRAKANADNNKRRRELYSSDPGYAERAKRAARTTYRKDNPLPESKIARGLLKAGSNREVTTDDMEHPAFVVAYTVPEAAEALGRTELCLKKWISDGIIPPPILRDTSRGYRQYSEGEVLVIARAVAEHEQEFKYLTMKHDTTIHRIWQNIQAYRASRI